MCSNEIHGRCWNIKKRRLKNDIANAVQDHALDALCLSTPGELNESLSSELKGGIKTWIMSLICSEMHTYKYVSGTNSCLSH